ncbi:MAG: hypothetical protein INQ03_03470 [Candidatus Heimdallarchaeota archaeon]|nr:hypothetical protein [Candidatus Heimdallarchaeota archaeon]
MSNVEYLSGLSIGHIMKRLLLDSETTDDEKTTYLKKYYSNIWKLYSTTNEFQRGFGLGFSFVYPSIQEGIIEFYFKLSNYYIYNQALKGIV